MADKKYYWLKFQKDFFTSKRIKKLRRLAGGDTYTIIYLKMQLLSVDTGGIIEYTGLEETFAEELALDIDENPDNVNVTVGYLLSCGLLEECENGYFLPYVAECTGTDSDGLAKIREQSRKRVANYRERQKTLSCNATSNVTGNVTGNECNALEKEKEIEKELELEQEIKKEKKETLKSVLDGYSSNPDLITTLQDYIEMRKTQKGFTVKALKLNLNELDKLAVNDEMKIDIVNQTIANGWKGFYPLKSQKTQQKQEERAF